LLTNPTALKVHHEGLSRDQSEQLAGDTGAPGIQADLMESDMAASNGVNGDHMEEDTA
jgi:hypothetical protein